MKREFIPFYISRAVLAGVFSILVMGLAWEALLLASAVYGGMLLYLHSGWFRIDLSHPLMPLRRDPRGQEIQRKALASAAALGLILYLVSPHLAALTGLPLPANIALPAGVITYFAVQFALFARA